MNPLIKPIKKALAARYGYKNVSVKNGSGTAWGWVEALVTVEGEESREASQAVGREAEEIAYKAVKEAGLEFYTYSSDDGYGEDRSCFLLHVSFKPKAIPMANTRDLDKVLF